MAYYILTLEENSGGIEHITHHLIEARDRQMVKYHFHKTLKDWGFRDTEFGKHCLEGARGLLSEIQEITEVERYEYEVMEKHIPNWQKED